MASGPNNEFVFDSPEQSAAIRRLLLDANAAEYSLPFCRVLRLDGRTVGFISVLSAAEVKKQRLRSALALNKGGDAVVPPAVRERMRLAGAALMPVTPGDAYFSRMAVLPEYAGRGLGRWLQEQAIAWGTSLGANRLLYDVVETNLNPLAMYRRRGCVEIGHAVAEDPATGRRIGYIHLALPLG